MSWSQMQPEDLNNQQIILVGSAIRLLCGEAGVFVVANEAFDPQSSEEYILYRLKEPVLPILSEHIQEQAQPNSHRPFVITPLSSALAVQLGLDEYIATHRGIELCSLALFDLSGSLGTLHFLRIAHTRSYFEQNAGSEEAEGDRELLPLFIAQVAAGLRFALKSQSLIKEQGRFAAIFHNSAEGILTVDNALRIIDFNPAMEHLTGWRESEVLGQFYFNILRPKDRQGNDLGLEDSPILQVFAGQSVVNREMIITTRDGEHFAVAITASCVRSSKGEPINGILNVRDITREREEEERRSTFISVISHELQTPIAIIKGYASTLARSDAHFDRATQHSRLVAIEEEADRLNKLVENLLYASRIQANGLQMDISSLDLASLIHKVVRRIQARRQDVNITASIPSNLPTVVADRERIEEVLLNLLDNAVKYSPRQQAVSISAHATGEEVIVSVSDSGMGISLRDQEQIFERFHRVGDPMSQATPGAGLGLYICRAIVEAHGGHIWVESTLRQGSTFSFSLPREERAQLPMVVF
ncbi:PAS domain S-box protein [Ktedonosporobacter rubrisoli]|uniref:histidine kinase n=1 Tax=Ktedonosporobacter rubrisoli TaxID=2509675 RepID=A0A4P6JWH0_KTERU|nr:ATP-binding protein [Ktedonosporobacter rubrisoli]QBD80048.1 PAS domain S-box protein [Ktedonosporobacter rubrisoli]